jgi:hypothetical protein
LRRLLRLTDRFFFQRSLLVAPRTLPAAALAATLGRLLDGALPGPMDFRTAVPDVDTAWVRRVPGASLWVYYSFTDDELTVWSLNNREPITTDG